MMATLDQPALAGKRAAGGPVIAGEPYLVGERGPEIIVPSSSGTVIPNGVSSGDINISLFSGATVNASSKADMNTMISDVEKAIAKVMQSQRRGLATQ
jgi:phage-related minor tail protein